MASPELAQAESVGELGQGIHLVGANVSRHAAGRFERDIDDAVASHLVGDDVAPHPTVEPFIELPQRVEFTGYILERFVHVTLPQLRHVMAVVFLFATIWMVNDFALIFIMTEGGPAKATLVVPITVYRFAFEHLRLGRGAAAAMILLVFLLSVSAIFIRVIFADRRGQASE